jgi:uncharacterized metal-binding protein
MILRSNTGITLSRIDDRLKVSNVDEISNYIRSLEVGNHGIFFCGKPHEKREVLFDFLQAGLEKGEGTVYVVRARIENNN